MDTCSERSFRSQKSSASYAGTVNSRRPLLSGQHVATSGDFSQSYYSDDEPQRRNFHRQRYHLPVVRPPLPPVPCQTSGSRDSARGYIDMGSPRLSDHEFASRKQHAKSSSEHQKQRFDKKKLTSMMGHQAAQNLTANNQYGICKSDSEFTDQSDHMTTPVHPPVALRHRHFGPPSNPGALQGAPQNHVASQPVAMQPHPPNIAQNAGLSAAVKMPQAVHPHVVINNNNNNSSHQVNGNQSNHHHHHLPEHRSRVKSFPLMPEINHAANIHPNTAEHGDAWEKDTVITGASNKSSSLENLPEFPSRSFGREAFRRYNPNHPGNNNPNALEESEYGGFYMDLSGPSLCQKWFTPVLSLSVVALVLMSPPSFALLPLFLWSESVCDYNCISTLMNIFFKSAILMVGCWAIFFRASRSTLPSVHLVRTLMIVFTLFYLICHWLFYVLKILMPRSMDQLFVLQFATNTMDCALFIYYLAVLCLEIMHFRTEYIVKVVRNTDGESRFYTVGHMSIQACAAWILQQYYKDFSVFNPAVLFPTPSAKAKANKFSSSQQYKFYDIDSFMQPSAGGGNPNSTNALIDKSRAIIAASARKRDAGHNDRFYEEQDLERRVKKRRARLIVAAEEAFSHLKRVDEEENFQLGSKPPMNASESAKAIFPSMARALQKYLKITSQQNRYTQEAIYDHLARCLTLDFTPKAFLEKYLNPGPVITSEAEQKAIQSWDLISDGFVNCGIRENVVFQLRQDALSLIVYVARVPHLYVREGSLDANQGTFVLRIDSETSV